MVLRRILVYSVLPWKEMHTWRSWALWGILELSSPLTKVSWKLLHPIFSYGKMCTLPRDQTSHLVGTWATECCGMNTQKGIEIPWFLSGKVTVHHKTICGVRSRWAACFTALLGAKTISLSKEGNVEFPTFSNYPLDLTVLLSSLSTWLMEPFATHWTLPWWQFGHRDYFMWWISFHI